MTITILGRALRLCVLAVGSEIAAVSFQGEDPSKVDLKRLEEVVGRLLSIVEMWVKAME